MFTVVKKYSFSIVDFLIIKADDNYEMIDENSIFNDERKFFFIIV